MTTKLTADQQIRAAAIAAAATFCASTDGWLSQEVPDVADMFADYIAGGR